MAGPTAIAASLHTAGVTSQMGVQSLSPGMTWVMFKGSFMSSRADWSPCRCGLFGPRGPFTIGMIAAGAEVSRSNEAPPARTLRCMAGGRPHGLIVFVH